MSILRKQVVEGSYVSGRLTGTTARIVVNDLPAPYIAEGGNGRALCRGEDHATGPPARGAKASSSTAPTSAGLRGSPAPRCSR